MAWKQMCKTKLFTRRFGPLQYGFIQRSVVSVMNIENIEMKKEALAFSLWCKKFPVLT